MKPKKRHPRRNIVNFDIAELRRRYEHDDGISPATYRDIMELLDRLEQLEAEHALKEKYANAYMAAEAKAAQHEKALRFYADERNWRQDFYPEVNASLLGSSAVECDNGDIAREALAQADSAPVVRADEVTLQPVNKAWRNRKPWI